MFGSVVKQQSFNKRACFQYVVIQSRLAGTYVCVGLPLCVLAVRLPINCPNSCQLKAAIKSPIQHVDVIARVHFAQRSFDYLYKNQFSLSLKWLASLLLLSRPCFIFTISTIYVLQQTLWPPALDRAIQLRLCEFNQALNLIRHLRHLECSCASLGQRCQRPFRISPAALQRAWIFGRGPSRRVFSSRDPQGSLLLRDRDFQGGFRLRRRLNHSNYHPHYLPHQSQLGPRQVNAYLYLGVSRDLSRRVGLRSRDVFVVRQYP
ncbi:hypothetical protein FGO68_gene7612 [Halteria grandinella]|uniref:Uncharacterized protein n=1 Tax=Halteria grandinella TaxID=5974 RepID=A0A8J8NFH4_HALGN|nr:hypothetical protein FGO68_gene7612 [Halteria grandinella]